MDWLHERVARRAAGLRSAKDFSSPEELKKYLQEHPQADRSKHKVNKAKPAAPPPAGAGAKPPKAPKTQPAQPAPKPKAKPEAGPAKPAPKPEPKPAPQTAPKPEAKPAPKVTPEAKPAPQPAPKPDEHGHDDDHGHDDGHSSKGRFDGWKKSLKGLRESAAKFVEKAPKVVKSFLGDPDFRKAALKEAKTAATELPKKAVHRLVETAKEEVHEFKEASAGIKAMMSGKKMSKHQKHAFKQVATHMAIGAAAAAFAATGPLAGAAVFTKNLATHVALKSVKKALGSLHTMNEVNHIGHGVMHLFEHIASDSKKEVDPEEAMTNLILASVAKQIEQLKDEDFTTVLNDIGGDDGSDGSDDDAASDAASDDADDGDDNSDDEQAIDKTAALSVLRRFLGGGTSQRHAF